MKTIAPWIRKQPVIAFFGLCFVISWVLWLPLILTHAELAELLGVVGVFSPALACVIVSRTLSTAPSDSRSKLFGPVFMAGWILAILALYFSSPAAGGGPILVALVIFAILALAPAYILASAAVLRPGFPSALASLLRPKKAWFWCLLALVLPLVFRLVSVWLSRLLDWELLSEPHRASNLMDLASSVLVIFLYTLFYAGGVNEEGGWTGLALPGLLAKFTPLISTIILWAMWMLWHIPLHLSGYFDLNSHVLLGSFFGRFLMTWLFLRSSGSLLTAVLLHTAVNVTSQFIPVTQASLFVDAAVAGLVIMSSRMWQRLPEEAVRRLAGDNDHVQPLTGAEPVG